MPQVSVVVPIYNVEEYLALSLQSLRNQDLQDIEIVCVNDGSTDASAEIARLFAEVDDRFVVIEQSNQGLSGARNTGIKAARGRYICFLDSDDLLEKNACSRIVEAFESHDVDVVTYGGIAYPELRNYPWLHHVLGPREVTYPQFDMDLLLRECSRPFAWRTACKRSFFERTGVLFDQSLRFGEDQLFQFAVYPRAHGVSLIPDRLVHYRLGRPGSLMESRMADQIVRLLDNTPIAEYIVNDWKAGGFYETYVDELIYWIVDFVGLDAMALDEPGRTQVLNTIEELFRRCFDEDVLKRAKKHSASGGIVRAILGQWGYRRAPLRQIAQYQFIIARDGRRAALDRFKRALRRHNPFAKPQHEVAHAEFAPINAEYLVWEEAEKAERMRALDAIRQEVKQYRQRNSSNSLR